MNPTLFAIAPERSATAVHAGDTVTKGQVLATLDSPELNNEYQRERATLDSLDAALAHQKIEIRAPDSSPASSRQTSRRSSIEAAERELKRAQWAWDQNAISERDYKRAMTTCPPPNSTSTTPETPPALERDSLALDLRTAAAGARPPVPGRRRPQAARGRADRALAGRRHGRQPRAAGKDAGRREHAAADGRRPDRTSRSNSRSPKRYAGDIKPGMAAEITLGGRTVSRQRSPPSPRRSARTRSPAA